MSNALGIDFGTTKTMVSYLNPATGRVELVRLGRDRDSVPSTVHADDKGVLLFGEDADDQIEIDPEGYCRAFKLHLGDEEPVLSRVGETAESLTARFLHHVKEECEQSVFHGGTVDKAIITIPVAFEPARKESLKRAAAKAGFSEVSFLPEPEAAGMAFLRDNPSDLFSKALVLDWGGGTLDIAIISRDEDGTIHADRHCAEGCDVVGGEEWDRCLLTCLDNLWRQAFGMGLLGGEENVPRLLREAEKAKIALSRKETVAFRRGPRKIEVTRAQFESSITALVDSAVGLVRSALDKNETRGNPPPDSIILVGGTSRIPFVRETMEKEFPGIRVLSWHHSHEAVALGATVPDREEGLVPVPVGLPNGIPEAFQAAWQMANLDLSPLGAVAGRETHPYRGFGAEDEALVFEKGLLVRRTRQKSFKVVPFEEESGKFIDILSFAGNPDGKNGKESGGTPLAQAEQAAVQKLRRQDDTLSKLQAEYDWFVGNSAMGYASKHRELDMELAQCKKAKQSVEAQLQRLKSKKDIGFFAALKAGWQEMGLESQINEVQARIDAKLQELRDLDEEAKRHEAWPVEEKSKELERAEETHHAVYLRYCTIRHFRIRWELEVLAGRKFLDGLKNKISALHESVKDLTKKIGEMEKQLPVLRGKLSTDQTSIAEKEKEYASVSQQIGAREEVLQCAIESKMGPLERIIKLYNHNESVIHIP